MHCPKCGEELSMLWMTEDATNTYDVDLDNEDKHLKYEQVDSSGDGNVAYGCLDCLAELAYTEPDAMAILKGELTQELAERFTELAMEGEG